MAISTTQKVNYSLVALLLLLSTAAGISSSHAQEHLTPLQIMERAYQIDGGSDSLSKVTFNIEKDGVRDKKIVLLSAWKHFKQHDELSSMSIMFNEFPPDVRDVAFLGWMYHPELGKQDDMWLYLPKIRSLRKMNHDRNSHEHNHGDLSDDDENFEDSELGTFELLPRYPELDSHTLLRRETLNGQASYVIESQPLDPATSPYSKSIQWITENDFLPIQIEYYDHHGALVKQLSYRWQQIEDAWLWDELIAINKKNGNRTTLLMSDVQLNIGLTKKYFSKRMMKLGTQGFLARVKQLTRSE